MVEVGPEGTPAIETRPPTKREEKWFDLLDELPFKSDENLARFADKLLGLSTAMLAAYLASIKLLLVDRVSWLTWAPVPFFLIALWAALWSMFPRPVSAEIRSLEDVQAGLKRGLRRRYRLVLLAAIVYIQGVLAAVFVLLLS